VWPFSGTSVSFTAPLGLRDHGYILMLDPNRVVAEMRRKDPGKVPDRCWSAFVARCAAIGLALQSSEQTDRQTAAHWECCGAGDSASTAHTTNSTAAAQHPNASEIGSALGGRPGKYGRACATFAVTPAREPNVG
jgi:hypothetical protein